jgi:sulfate permease, SulP family
MQVTSRLKSILPIAGWLPSYSSRNFQWDLFAGITLASFVLPESMAYATLAGLPSVFGIYCCIAGGLLFALFTTSGQLVVGPTSAISLMVGTTVAVLSNGDLSRWIAIAELTAFSVFIFCVLAYLLKLSNLVNFISENILLGFKTGAAFAIGVTQLPKLTGVDSGGSNFFERIYHFCLTIPQANMTILLFGLSALLLLIVGYRLFPGRPISLAVVILSILVATFTPITSHGLHVLGTIPAGLPHLTMPSLNFRDVDGIFGLALGVFLMGYIETTSAARTFAEKNGYEISPRQELLSLGVANLATAFVNGYPVSGGLSQSTVNDKAGAKTPLALIICSVTLSFLLLFFTGLLRNLPHVILAVVVLEAVSGLIKYRELKKLYSLSKMEFWVAMIAVAGVLMFGILQGVLIAALSSLAIFIYRASAPNIAMLGRIPGTNKFSDIFRHPDNEELPGCRIFRVESSILYFNQQLVREKLLYLVQKSGPGIKLVILDLSSSPVLDVSASKMLVRLTGDFGKMGITFRVVEALSEVREILRKLGMEEVIGHISRKQSIAGVIEEFFKETRSE